MDFPAKWFFVGPAWGDSIICYNNAVSHSEFKDNPNVIFSPSHSGMIDFFLRQDTIKNWIHLPWDRFLSLGIYHQWFNRSKIHADLPKRIIEAAGGMGELVVNHVINQRGGIAHKRPKLITRNSTDRLRKVEVLPEKYILIQPYSLNSTTYKHHSPYWLDLIKFCLLFDILVVLVNANRIHLEHPNLINLSASLPSMEDVYDLSAKSIFTITTTNSLSFFVSQNNVPSLVFCNTAATVRPDLIWRKYINLLQRQIILERDASLDEIKWAITSMIALYVQNRL